VGDQPVEKRKRRKKVPPVKPELSNGPVLPSEVAQTRAFLGMKAGDFGNLLGGITARSITRYERGDTAIPTAVGNAIRDLLYPRTTRAVEPEEVPPTPEEEPVTATEPRRRRRRVEPVVETKVAGTKKLLYTIEVYEHS
jgi:predicted transcriptional regulator